MPDRRTPFTVAGEKQTLLDFLDYLRESVILKVDGLSDADARRAMVPSGTSLLGLLKHLALVERWWFHVNFAGGDMGPDADNDFAVGDHETVESIVSRYRAEVENADAIVAGADLEQHCASERSKALTLRWVLVHMVEETARHAGHADICRELIDGTTGR